MHDADGMDTYGMVHHGDEIISKTSKNTYRYCISKVSVRWVYDFKTNASGKWAQRANESEVGNGV